MGRAGGWAGKPHICGPPTGTTAESLQLDLTHKALADHLPCFTPKPGDAVFLPAGTVHALGGDVVVFEIQQNSDVTFRLYDWDHVDERTGKLRALQVDQAIACIDFAQGPLGPVVRSWRRPRRRRGSGSSNVSISAFGASTRSRPSPLAPWERPACSYAPTAPAKSSTAAAGMASPRRCHGLAGGGRHLCVPPGRFGEPVGGWVTAGNAQTAVGGTVKRLIVFDLDGTLTESKSAPDSEMSKLLHDLLGLVKVAVISGGDWEQFEEQLLSALPGDERLESLSSCPLVAHSSSSTRAAGRSSIRRT